MSPALLSHAPARRSRLRHLAVAALATLGTFAAVAPAAQAAKTTLAFTDPADDASGIDVADLISGTFTYDDVTGSLSATITTKAPVNSSPNAVAVIMGLGQATATGDCTTDTSTSASVGFFYVWPGASTGQPEQSFWGVGGAAADGSTQTGIASTTYAGNSFTVTTTGDTTALKGKTLTCAQLSTSAANTASFDDGSTSPDTAIALVAPASSGGSGSGSGTAGSSTGTTGKSNNAIAPITAPVVTNGVDTDRDGTADEADKCPTVAGAQKNGCPTMPPALEIRLGARRVVVDKLVLRTTATSCPKLVRIHVTAKGKLIGNGVVSTSQFGSFCRVNGVVKTKKSVKAVRVTMVSKGLARIAKSARR